MRIKPIKEFNRALTPPPDKSITIRAVILGWLAKGVTTVYNPLFSGDTVAAMDAVTMLGAELNLDKGAVVVRGGNLYGGNIDARNSATAMRLIVGALSARNVVATVTGDSSLSRRSMKNLIDVLSTMGADIESKNGYAPLKVRGTSLHGIDFVPSFPSAQIKSAVLLAGLNAQGRTTVTEKIKTRAHTEEMLKIFGADIKEENGVIILNKSVLSGTKVNVPGDISSAAYPIVLALKKGFCYIKNVGTSRRELIDFLVSIGGQIEEENMGDRANLVVKKSLLKPFDISGSLSAALIDELPLLATLACTIEGESTITDAYALRNKECDRIKCTVNNLRNMGADIIELNDGFKISGKGIKGGNALSYGDHRMAMSMAVANALSLSGGTIDDEKCVAISYPSFWELFI